MKTQIAALSLFALLVFTSAKTTTETSDVSERLIGTWVWRTVLDGQTKEDTGIDIVTMGMASEVKTEFKKDNTYVESKMRKGTTEYSTTTGEWKLEGDEILNMKAKDKWRPAKIVRMANDSLLLQMNPKLVLVLVKKK